MLIPYLPFDILNLILEYDGRIKYIHKDRIYVNIINKYDYRYNIIKQKMNIKLNLINRLGLGIGSNNALKYFIHIYFKNLEVGLMFCKKRLLY